MHESPPSLTELTTYLLSRTGKQARGLIGARLAERGLQLWHMAVLAALADFGPHAQRDLAQRLAIHPSDVAKVLEELGRLGQVARERDPADRRRMVVTLTEAGLVALARLRQDALEVQERVLAPLTAAEQEQLQALLLRVYAALFEPGMPEG
ncbi:MarR family winged helix-turn-helix transcriptional regulator [Streptomyces roseoverticillatus]|uniref:MarR family winged helix-turn-helix transcriptional regulator n=1 Tax=Streptomyces roseoverticillatus TaxID=66429 RepID=UPI0033E98C86